MARQNNGNLFIEQIELAEPMERGLSNFKIIDVRSPSEYMLDHIPYSVNIPILGDAERAAVGTVYKQQGTREAKMLAVELVSPKLPKFIKELSAASEHCNTIITCWRGGMRSGAAVTLGRLAGIHSVRLAGGYAEFRRHVHAFFEEFPQDYRFITLFGTTGGGKTAILEELERRGYPVINLEKHACHKGSSFGSVAEKGYAKVTQKSFETGVWLDFYKHGGKKLFFIEGESQKIGKVTLPKQLYNAMRTSIKVMASAPMDFRIAFTVNAYRPEDNIEEIVVSLQNIERYLSKAKVTELKELLNRGEFAEFTRIMLETYYDPMYKNAFPKDMDEEIEYSSIEEGVKMCEELYEKYR